MVFLQLKYVKLWLYVQMQAGVGAHLTQNSCTYFECQETPYIDFLPHHSDQEMIHYLSSVIVFVLF